MRNMRDCAPRSERDMVRRRDGLAAWNGQFSYSWCKNWSSGYQDTEDHRWGCGRRLVHGVPDYWKTMLRAARPGPGSYRPGEIEFPDKHRPHYPPYYFTYIVQELNILIYNLQTF